MVSTWEFENLSDDQLLDTFIDVCLVGQTEWGPGFQEKVTTALKERKIIGEA